MAEKRNLHNDPEVLQFILAAINKGKTYDKTRGIDFFTSGLWRALQMFRPSEGYPLKYIFEFVKSGDLLIRATNRNSFFIYDPKRTSPTIWKKCIKSATVTVEGVTEDTDQPSRDLIIETFEISQAAALGGGELNFEFTSKISSENLNQSMIVSDEVVKIEGYECFSISSRENVNGKSTSYEYLVRIPDPSNSGEFYEALRHATHVYNKSQYAAKKLEQSGFDFDKAQKLYILAKSLLDGEVDPGKNGNSIDEKVLAEAEKALKTFYEARYEYTGSQSSYVQAEEGLRTAEEIFQEREQKLNQTKSEFDRAVDELKKIMEENPLLGGILGQILKQYKTQ